MEYGGESFEVRRSVGKERSESCSKMVRGFVWPDAPTSDPLGDFGGPT